MSEYGTRAPELKWDKPHVLRQAAKRAALAYLNGLATPYAGLYNALQGSDNDRVEAAGGGRDFDDRLVPAEPGNQSLKPVK